MRKIIKTALIEEQILKKNKISADGYEIHLLGNDDFRLMPLLNKEIITMHIPFSMCDIDKFIENIETEYVKKILNICKEKDIGIVLHVIKDINKIDDKLIEKFIKTVDIGLNLHIENVSACLSKIVIETCAFLNSKFNKSKAYPLLDTCHHLISLQMFDRDEYSLPTIINMFESENFKVHFADCLGDGHEYLEGKHGTNFSNNHLLMKNFLDKFNSLKYVPDIIIEVTENNVNDTYLMEDLLNNISKAGY